MIQKLSGIEAVFKLPVITAVDTESLQSGNLKDIFDQSVPLNDIVHLMDIL